MRSYRSRAASMISSRVRAFLRSRRPLAASTTFFMSPIMSRIASCQPPVECQLCGFCHRTDLWHSLDIWHWTDQIDDMTSLLYRLGRATVRRRRLVLLAWAAVALTVIVVGQAAGGRTSDAFTIPGVESQHALDVL